MSQRPASFGSYAQRHVHPRIFNTFDTKRDGSIDFEEYLCGVTVFRSGSVDDKLKCTFATSPKFNFLPSHRWPYILVHVATSQAFILCMKEARVVAA